MKIGILSMQRVKNYGSFLQAFALRKTVESYNHDCEFIDIELGRQLKEYRRSTVLYLKKARERLFTRNIFHQVRNQYLFRKKFDSYLDMLDVSKNDFTSYDLAIIGSDEVFNVAQYTSWGFTTQLFGDISNTRRVISYAGSFGNTTLEIIYKYKLQEKISLALKKLSIISVRDNNSRNIVKKLLDMDPVINVDPVLFYDFNKYIKSIEDKNYILIYTYPGRMNDKNEVYSIKQIAKKLNKKLISIGFFFDWCDKTVIPEPFQVLSYFINADFIITDTFHGSILSVKYNKKFAVFIRNSNSNKLIFLLNSLGLTDRIVYDSSKIDSVLFQHVNYEYTNKVIDIEIKKSRAFFQDNL